MGRINKRTSSIQRVKEIMNNTATTEQLEAELISVFIQCPECCGKGTVERTIVARPYGHDPYEDIEVTCPRCDGNREVEVERMNCCGKSDYLCTCLEEAR